MKMIKKQQTNLNKKQQKTSMLRVLNQILRKTQNLNPKPPPEHLWSRLILQTTALSASVESLAWWTTSLGSKCLNCLLWQHAECVNYKEENLETTPFYCPHCLVAMTPVSTGATLIISPSSICHQWVDEINRHIHTSSLRVLVRTN